MEQKGIEELLFIPVGPSQVLLYLLFLYSSKLYLSPDWKGWRCFENRLMFCNTFLCLYCNASPQNKAAVWMNRLTVQPSPLAGMAAHIITHSRRHVNWIMAFRSGPGVASRLAFVQSALKWFAGVCFFFGLLCFLVAWSSFCSFVAGSDGDSREAAEITITHWRFVLWPKIWKALG